MKPVVRSSRGSGSSRRRRTRQWIPERGPRPGPVRPPALPTDPLRPRPEPRGGSASCHWPPPHRGGREPPPDRPRLPSKLTVTRVAAWRGRDLTTQGLRAFHRATTADGAGRSGLSALTYATMANFAADASVAVGLANTLFFSAATAESKAKVALYLLVTMAPFAVIAPVIGPLLDRVQRGRRVALAGSFLARSLLVVVIALHLDDWLLYPAALGFLVLSKSFNVLKAAVTPRVLPPEGTLVRTNARLTVFGLIAGGAVGAVTAGFAAVLGSSGALWFTAVVCLAGVWLCTRIPAWVEVTAGEVPASLRLEPEHGRPRTRRQPMGRHIVLALWGAGTTRVLTGFLTLFVAFVVKAQTEGSPGRQLLLLGLVGAGAGAGSFLGNAGGARMHFGRPDQVIIWCVSASLAAAVVAGLLPGIVTAALAGLVAASSSALAKVCVDATVQRDMPEASRASAFGRSETVLQLAWVLGGAVGLLLPPVYWVGFGTVSLLLGLGLSQALLSRAGSSLVPGLGGDRPLRPAPTPSRRRERNAPADDPTEAVPSRPMRGAGRRVR